MNVSKRVILVIAAGIFFSGVVPSMALKKVGQAGMQFLKLSSGARTLAMGNTGIAINQYDANGLFINPAVITQVEANSFGVNYCDYFLDMNLGSFVFIHNFGDFGSLAISTLYFGMGEFEETLEDADFHLGTGRTFTAGSYSVGLAYAVQLTDRFSIGGHLRYAREDLDLGNDLSDMWSGDNQDNVANFALDVGTFYDTGFHNLKLGAVVQNFGPDVTFIEEKTSMPFIFRIGAGIDFENVFGPNNVLTLTFESFNARDYQERIHVGAEFNLADFLFLRGGYKFPYDLESVTGGIGVKAKVGSMKYLVDLSYMPVSGYLTDLMTFSLGVVF